jgi:hypothetical protein
MNGNEANMKLLNEWQPAGRHVVSRMNTLLDSFLADTKLMIFIFLHD